MGTHIIYIFLLCIGASFIQRTTGFGFGIFIMTMLPFLLPSYGEATTLSGLLALTTSAAISYRLRKVVSWRRLIPILLTFIAVSALAVFSLRSIDDSLLRRILGVVLVFASLYFIFLSSRIHIRPTLPFQVTAGGSAGCWAASSGCRVRRQCCTSFPRSLTMSTIWPLRRHISSWEILQ